MTDAHKVRQVEELPRSAEELNDEEASQVAGGCLNSPKVERQESLKITLTDVLISSYQ